jgi:hypothetical protein
MGSTPHPDLSDWRPVCPERGFTLDAESLSSYRRMSIFSA